MGWNSILHDNAGEEFRSRILALRPTLMGLYHSTRAYSAEWEEVHVRYLKAQPSFGEEPDSSPGEVSLEQFELREELMGDGKAFNDAANGYGQAFVMVVNPALQELKKSVNGSVFTFGPIVHDGIQLAHVLWELANSVRHGHGIDNYAIPATAAANHFTDVCARLNIAATSLNASRAFIMKWCPSTYRQFERDLFQIGHDASEQYPDK